jgi:hypothetical protein
MSRREEVYGMEKALMNIVEKKIKIDKPDYWFIEYEETTNSWEDPEKMVDPDTWSAAYSKGLKPPKIDLIGHNINEGSQPKRIKKIRIGVHAWTDAGGEGYITVQCKFGINNCAPILAFKIDRNTQGEFYYKDVAFYRVPSLPFSVKFLKNLTCEVVGHRAPHYDGNLYCAMVAIQIIEL